MTSHRWKYSSVSVPRCPKGTSIIQVLSTKIDNYRKTDILQPSDDMVLEQDKVIMAGDINATVRNVVQSARGKE